ncbi:hypothetical protein GCM10020254_41610 [Streptomyces goshikiensis]
MLIGAEIPLLMVLIQRIRRQDAGGAVADLFAADYVGALVGGLAFPFLLLPVLGQLTGAMLTGGINVVVGGGLVLWLFRHDLSRRCRWLLIAVNLTVLAALCSATVLADDFERVARRAVYGGEVRVAVQTGVQELVLTGPSSGSPRSLDLFLDGRLRVSGYDEYRYHEALVHPAMTGPHARVLVLGGGDGLAAREVLRYPDVTSVTVVEIDPGVVRLARTDPMLSALNGRAYEDPRLGVVTQDAFRWLRGPAAHGRFDVIVSDLPDPGITPPARSCTPRSSTGWPRGPSAPAAASRCTRGPSRPGPGPTGPSSRRCARPGCGPSRTAPAAASPASPPGRTGRRAPGARRRRTGASSWPRTRGPPPPAGGPGHPRAALAVHRIAAGRGP